MVVDFVNYGSIAEKAGISFGWTINKIQVQKDRPRKELMFIPALILLALLAYGQFRRKGREDLMTQAT